VTTVPGRHAARSASVVSVRTGGRHPAPRIAATARSTVRPQERGADPVVAGRFRRGPPGQLPGQQLGQTLTVRLIGDWADDDGSIGADLGPVVAHPGPLPAAQRHRCRR